MTGNSACRVDAQEHDATVIATFAGLVHAWRKNDFRKAADCRDELERLGVNVKMTRSDRKGGVV